MPGTRPINLTQVGDPPEYESPEGAPAGEILSALAQPPEERASECFAVAGEGLDALRGARAVLVEGQARQTTFDKDEPVTLVFFSHQFGSYIHLVGAKEQHESIELSYRVVSHETREITVHFALIPLQALGSGAIAVEVKLDIDSAAASTKQESEAQRIVCRSFDFEVSG